MVVSEFFFRWIVPWYDGNRTVGFPKTFGVDGVNARGGWGGLAGVEIKQLPSSSSLEACLDGWGLVDGQERRGGELCVGRPEALR